jgi:TnpA family transposase
MGALEFLMMNRHKRSETLEAPPGLCLGFISDVWKQLVYEGKSQDNLLNRRFFEICVFTYLSYELGSGDVFIQGADEFSDYRASLFTPQECQDILNEESQPLGLPTNADEFVRELKNELTEKSRAFDDLYPNLPDFIIDTNGIPSLKKTPTPKPTAATLELVAQIQQHMPERSLLDILCSTHHTTGWGFEFGPLSGSEPKFKQPIDRYILNTFCHGTGMGPTQTAKHVRTPITPHMLSRVNQRHVTINALDQAKDRVVNLTKDFSITKAWGDGSRCAADGTLRDIYEDNLVAESHFRYLAKGGIAYNHVADTYVALFSTFMRCGLWEAVSILDGLLKNDAIIKPTIVHADTQGQSTVVFGLSHLLGIKLMPRIRNWKDLKFFRPDKNSTYQNVDSLFSDAIDWDLIKTHWQDLIQVVLSIKYGKISSSLLLRKLGTYSRKNRLYQAFQELGRVIRTIFLLEYLSSPKLREIITATTNKVEAYNALSEWVFFGSRIIVASNDPDEMEKAIKYNLLINNCVILQNIVDLTETIHKLQSSGVNITKEDIARLSPYITSHIKRFGDYFLDLGVKPIDVERVKNLCLFL